MELSLPEMLGPFPSFLAILSAREMTGQRYGPRVLIGVSSLLALLLVILAVMQYRWAGRVAEADAQRTMRSLETATASLAREFDLDLAQVFLIFQSQAVVDATDHQTPALRSFPPLLGSAWKIRNPSRGQQALKLRADGVWEPADAVGEDTRTAIEATKGKQGDPTSFCDAIMLPDLPGFLIPSLEPPKIPSLDNPPHIAACIVVKLNERYIHDTLLPALIHRHFGDSAKSYDFAIASRSRTIYDDVKNHTSRADFEQNLFDIRLDEVFRQASTRQFSEAHSSGPPRRIVMTYRQTALDARSNRGQWRLSVYHRGGPVQSAVAGWRRQNLLISAGVEVLLLAAIGFLLLSTRRLQRAADQKMQFVAGVSHELRTPLSAINMLSRNQADGLVKSTEQVRQYGTLMYEQCRRLTEMVEQTLEYAGIQSGRRKPNLEDVDVNALIQGALDARRPDLERAGFEIVLDIEPNLPRLAGDSHWLQKAIVNLISNAEKYAGERKWIRIAAARDAERNRVLITVEDHGIGIDPSDRNELFKPFARGKRAVAAQIPGSGLGLSLVRSTAEAHRGAVTFVSEPNHGSAFTLNLPVAPAPNGRVG